MKNMKFSEFLNLMYEKQEIEFSYNGHVYNFELSSENLDENKPLMVNLYELFDDKDGICISEFLFNQETYIEDINALINKPLFNGKSLLEIELEITVLYNS